MVIRKTIELQNKKYLALIHSEEDRFWVEFPELNGCFSDGSTLSEALRNCKEALQIYLNTTDDLYPREI